MRRTVSMRTSRLRLLVGGMLEFVLGLTQLLRGAHFASQSPWTAWIGWSLSALLRHSAAVAPLRFRRLRAR